MKTHYIFDMDGCLTPPTQPMTPEVVEFFEEWCKTHEFSIVTGSDLKKVQTQIPELILIDATYIFTCSGNDVYEYACVEKDGDFVPNLIHQNEFTPSPKLLSFLDTELKYSNWSKKYGNHIEMRNGSMNFSVCGRNASVDERKEYYEWDKQDGERKRIANYINERFPEYESSIGGMISVDVYNKGQNKGQILDYFSSSYDNILFFGDKIESGNDKPLSDKINQSGCGVSYNVTGPKEVIEILEVLE